MFEISSKKKKNIYIYIYIYIYKYFREKNLREPTRKKKRPTRRVGFAPDRRLWPVANGTPPHRYVVVHVEEVAVTVHVIEPPLCKAVVSTVHVIEPRLRHVGRGEEHFTLRCHILHSKSTHMPTRT